MVSPAVGAALPGTPTVPLPRTGPAPSPWLQPEAMVCRPLRPPGRRRSRTGALGRAGPGKPVQPVWQSRLGQGPGRGCESAASGWGSLGWRLSGASLPTGSPGDASTQAGPAPRPQQPPHTRGAKGWLAGGFSGLWSVDRAAGPQPRRQPAGPLTHPRASWTLLAASARPARWSLSRPPVSACPQALGELARPLGACWLGAPGVAGLVGLSVASEGLSRRLGAAPGLILEPGAGTVGGAPVRTQGGTRRVPHTAGRLASERHLLQFLSVSLPVWPARPVARKGLRPVSARQSASVPGQPPRPRILINSRQWPACQEGPVGPTSRARAWSHGAVGARLEAGQTRGTTGPRGPPGMPTSG